jgi:hypothetical protein
MFLSKKRKSVSSENDIHQLLGLQKLFEMIAPKCIGIQNRVAAAMQKGSEHLSVTGKKVALMTFCFISVAASIYAFSENIFYKKKSTHLLLSPISITKHVFEKDNRTSDILPETELNKIENFQKYIDSLSKSVSGQKVKDSILKFRPLLMDSINQLEKLYQLQEKNKK